MDKELRKSYDLYVAMKGEKDKELRLICCYLDNKTWKSCGATATYEITYGITPDDYTHTCDEHIFEMLTDARHHELTTL